MTWVLRLADASSSLGRAAAALFRGALRTCRLAGRDAAAAARRLAVREPMAAGRLLAIALARMLLQLPADALLLLGARLVSTLQTVLAIEPPGRSLAPGELTLLRQVYGQGIDPRPIRVKVGRLGLLGLPGRAFVVADTIHVPLRRPAAAAPLAADLAGAGAALLVHELAHVWQHQRHGTRYLSECLLAQWLGAGYNVAAGLVAGRSFSELNFEQQAELLERAATAGWFTPPPAPGQAVEEGRRLLMRLLDPDRDDGFECRLVRGVEGATELLAAGWVDATALLRDGLAAVQAPPSGTADGEQDPTPA